MAADEITCKKVDKFFWEAKAPYKSREHYAVEIANIWKRALKDEYGDYVISYRTAHALSPERAMRRAQKKARSEQRSYEKRIQRKRDLAATERKVKVTL